MKKRFFGSQHYKGDPKERFDAKYILNTETGCWEWTAALNVWGYGQFKYEGKMLLAHRVSHILNIGPIPEGKLVCHKCDNTKCVNPNHFFLGTNKENCDDKTAKNRQHKMKHPSITAYGKGCRCIGCKVVYAAYQKEYKERKKASV